MALREQLLCKDAVGDPAGGATPSWDTEVSMGSTDLAPPTWFHAAYCAEDSAGISARTLSGDSEPTEVWSAVYSKEATSVTNQSGLLHCVDS